MNQIKLSCSQHTSLTTTTLRKLLFSLALGMTIAIALCLTLKANKVSSAAYDQRLSQGIRILQHAPTTTTLYITKTVEPPVFDTGETVSICFTITVSNLKTVPLDVVLAQDVSGSMTQTVNVSVTETRLAASQAAAGAFVSLLADTDRTAVVAYSSTAVLAHPLTTSKSVITTTLNALTATGNTNIGEGIRISHYELISSPHYVSNTLKTIILLTDGIANRPYNEELGRAYAREKASAAADDGIKIYTIGFGSDADQSLLQEIATLSEGRFFFAPDSETLEEIYNTIETELRGLVITDILTPGVKTECSQWAVGQCTTGASGVTTVTYPISNSLYLSNTAISCFPVTMDLDPPYQGLVNLPGSDICYQDQNGNKICKEFDNPTVTVGGRKIAGTVFWDINANGHQESGESGVPNIVVGAIPPMTGTTIIWENGITDSTDISGNFVLRTSESPTLTAILNTPEGYQVTTPISETVPTITGIHTVTFGIRAVVYLPMVIRNYEPLDNGGFELGWTGWEHDGELGQSISHDNKKSGEFAALLGEPSYVCQGGVPVGEAWLEQTFSVPQTQQPKLSFWYNIVTQDANPYLEVMFDSFDVRVNDELVFRDANTSSTYGCAPQDKTDLGWRYGEINLVGHQGTPITLRFENRNSPDGWFNTWTYVDDVQVIP